MPVRRQKRTDAVLIIDSDVMISVNYMHCIVIIMFWNDLHHVAISRRINIAALIS